MATSHTLELTEHSRIHIQKIHDFIPLKGQPHAIYKYKPITQCQTDAKMFAHPSLNKKSEIKERVPP